MFKKIIDFFEGGIATAISGLFLIVSFVFSVSGVDLPKFLNPAFVAVVVSGTPIIYGAIQKLMFNKGILKISSALLISIAIIASVAIGDIFAAGEVAFIMAIGEILEHKTTKRAKRGLKKLIELTPDKTRRIMNGKEENITVSEVLVGDILRIFPGERIPVDGVIVSGETSLDQSIITGESLPVDKAIGDEVYCGTVNCYGTVDIKAISVGEDSSLKKLIRMVKEAEDKKAPMARIADRWASILVPIALILAALGGILTKDITVAVTVLVVFCPCALVLTTPTAIMAAIGQATKHGVIIKSGEALEVMGRVNTIAFDKTGTLTVGKLALCDIITINKNYDEIQLLAITASVEQKSEHPLGKAITKTAKDKKINLYETENFSMKVGRGVSAEIENDVYYCGNEKYLLEMGISIPENVASHIKNLSSLGKAMVITAKNSEILGIIGLSNMVKDNSQETIKELNDMEIETVLLTGDNNNVAAYFGKMVGIKNIKAELLPVDKVNTITQLMSKNTVCMIGDGVNDAPALKTADVGIAMGSIGSDIAVDSADIAVIGDDISKIPYLKRLSMATVRTIRLGIGLSLFINFAAIILSFLRLLTPTTGALVHNLGAIFVVGIATHLYDRKF